MYAYIFSCKVSQAKQVSAAKLDKQDVLVSLPPPPATHATSTSFNLSGLMSLSFSFSFLFPFLLTVSLNERELVVFFLLPSV